MKIKKTFQGELPENRVVNTYSDSLTDAYSANYLNDKLRNVEVSLTEPTNGKDIWVQIGKNLFNKNKDLISLRRFDSSGEIVYYDASFCQEAYIQIEPNTSYAISVANIDKFRVCEYDKDKTFLTRFVSDDNITSCIFAAGPSTHFIRISCKISNIDSLQIEQGEFKTDYEPYIPKKIYVKDAQGNYDKVYDESGMQKEVYVGPTEPKSGEKVWIQKGKNLFNKNSVNKLNAYFDASVTIIKSHSNNRTLYIPCEPNTTYTVQKYLSNQFSVGYTTVLPAADVQVYNAANGSRGDYSGTIVHKTITTGGDAKYLVLRYYNSANDTTVTEQEMLDSIQIERGSKSTSYEPYIPYKEIYTKNDDGAYEKFGQAFEFEEGSWTPGVGNDGGASPTTSYSKRRGYYKKIGKLVFVDFYLEGAITQLNATNNYATITGLPFPAQSNSYFGQNCLHIGTIYKLVSNSSNEGFTLIIYNKLIRVQAGWGAGAATLQASDRFIISGSGWYITD